MVYLAPLAPHRPPDHTVESGPLKAPLRRRLSDHTHVDAPDSNPQRHIDQPLYLQPPHISRTPNYSTAATTAVPDDDDVHDLLTGICNSYNWTSGHSA